MNKKNVPIEFMYQVAALLVAFILVHAFYTAMVRPNAQAILEEEAVMIDSDPNYVPKRSVYVIIKDFEQEACFVLFFWAIAIMAFKASEALRERSLLQKDLVHLEEGMKILPEDTREYSRQIQRLPQSLRDLLLPRALLTALQRFNSTRSIQAVSSATTTVCETEAERMDSELSMVRYIAWAIPSIGFIGTVRGIGQALALAHQAVEGNISGVTRALGVAFNSTFVALILSIILMFLVHQLQLLQERLVFETENYCDDRLIRHLAVQ